jgi:hypothetical protein
VGATRPRATTRGAWRVEKIDAHVHLHGTADRFMAQALQDNFRILTINVDDADYPISRAQRGGPVAAETLPGRVAYAATFSVASFQAQAGAPPPVADPGGSRARW